MVSRKEKYVYENPQTTSFRPSRIPSENENENFSKKLLFRITYGWADSFLFDMFCSPFFFTKNNIQEDGGLNNINLPVLVYSSWLKHKQCVSLKDLTRTSSHVSNGTERTSKTGDKSFVGGRSWWIDFIAMGTQLIWRESESECEYESDNW